MTREFAIRRAVALPATPEQVWRMIATADGMASWFMPGDDDPAAVADVVDPPHRLRVPIGGTQAMEFLIEADHGGTARLRFVHSGVLDEADWSDEFDAMTRAGWDMYLHTLAAHLSWFPDRFARYVEAEAPADHGSAWPSIVDALGDPRAPGPAAGVELPGRRLSGVVDYVTARFLGLRTPDGLVRFHERSAIGLPVAVSHHDHSGTDPGELRSAWETWLEGATR